ncbi:hypothetical protein [Chitinimonas taiwanensis]|uniref:Uncharacterized protein n=1 Tax=Chitinimonas taiwanensis DSM 18899 TaxID=1121279 RepID=A0A1K2HM33_9NEIS|nr:hypothetical protein [Chitinimonas taiwanensis]SFZ77749.1 hypothetical protein SAMN02745887_02565 [Chitinimonas taiwanensis DSM 18899]
MRLMAYGLPAAMQSRLQAAGLLQQADSTRSGTPDAARLWLHAGDTLPPLQPDDLVLHFGPLSAASLPVSAVLVLWQDSPFAAQYGYMLIAGGPTPSLRATQAVLDALAPAPGAWLQAGGQHAPAFLGQLTSELGGGLLGLAGLMQSAASTGFNPLWLAQRQLQSRLARLANAYLAASVDEGYESLQPQAAWPIDLPGLADSGKSPARKLASLLLWLNASMPRPANEQPETP